MKLSTSFSLVHPRVGSTKWIVKDLILWQVLHRMQQHSWNESKCRKTSMATKRQLRLHKAKARRSLALLKETRMPMAPSIACCVATTTPTTLLSTSTSTSTSAKLCPPVSNRDVDQSVLLFNGECPLLECSVPKDVVWSLATGQLRSSWGQPTARVCLHCSKVPTRVFSQMIS